MIRKRSYKCPYCEFRATSQNIVRVHIRTLHKEQLTGVKSAISNVLINNKSVADILKDMSDMIVKGQFVSKDIPQEVIDRLREEDVRLQIALRIIAITKLDRVQRLLSFQSELDGKLDAKLHSKSMADIEKVPVGTLLNLNDTIQKAIIEELNVIDKLSSLNNINIAEAIETLADTMSDYMAKYDSNIVVPQDSATRDRIRSIVVSLIESRSNVQSGRGTTEVIKRREITDKSDSE